MSATLVLSLPHAKRPVTLNITADTLETFRRKVTREIEAFARSRGVSRLAVDYEIVRGRR